MVNKILYDIQRYEEEALKTRNRLIEAVWRVIVGNDTVEPEDGQMIKQPYVQTERGPGSIYNFIYKGKPEAVLTEVQRVPGEFSYFLQSDREMMGEVMEQVTELAVAKKERKCENGNNADRTGHENISIHIYTQHNVSEKTC